MPTTEHTTQEELMLDQEGTLTTEVQEESENAIEKVAGQFGLNGSMFAAQLVNFVIVLGVLWVFAYKPIMKLLDERQVKIEKSMKQADEIEKRVVAIEKEHEAAVTAAKKEAQTIITAAQAQGEARRNEIIDAAKREVERVIVKGKEQLQAEREEMLRDLRKDLVDISMKAAARILQHSLDEHKSSSMAEEVVRKMT
ncbi:MAG: F0F1 ATP synthase subunit B [Patescibacteria group bacterium]|jgi:F-type H+-transporting ATPase subunit b